MAAQGDLSYAREKYGKALAFQNGIGAPETALGLAELELLDGRPAQGEKLAREAEQALRVEGSKALAARAQTVIGAALLAQGKLAEAKSVHRAAEVLVAQTHVVSAHLLHEILGARLCARAGGAQGIAEALRILERIERRAAAQGFGGLRLEARLAECEVRVSGGGATAALLDALERDASAAGFGGIAKRARAIHSAH